MCVCLRVSVCVCAREGGSLGCSIQMNEMKHRPGIETNKQACWSSNLERKVVGSHLAKDESCVKPNIEK